MFLAHVGPLRADDNLSNWIHNAIISQIPGESQLPLVDNYNSGVGCCASDTPQLFLDKVLGVRASVNRAYLPPGDRQANGLKIIELAEVDYIKDTNIVVLTSGKQIKVNEKIILAAGAIYTPFILLKSPALNSNPNIGQNLKTHYGCTMVLAAKGIKDFSSGPMAFVNRDGDQNGVRNWQIVTSGSTLTNLQFLQDQGVDVQYYQNNGYTFITFLGWDLEPQAIGSISVEVGNKMPNIKLGLFEQQEDNDSIVELLRYFGRIFFQLHNTINGVTNDVQVLFPDESVFINDNYSDLLSAMLRRVQVLTDHYSRTCEMGVVLNQDFSLVGHPNIHVVDTSNFPAIPDGNTEWPTLIISELAATRI